MENERQRGQDIGPSSLAAADRIRRHRLERRHSLQFVADSLAESGHRIGVSALSKIETGKRRIDVDDLAALSKHFVVSIPDLIGFGEKAPLYPIQVDPAASAEYERVMALPQAEQEAILEMWRKELEAGSNG